MGRRRTVGETRSAGAGRACKHPTRVREYQAGSGGTYRIRCRRCGQELLALADVVAPVVPYTTRAKGR
jgi:hypothetical protein